jgi:hypothetical protein
MSPSDLVLAAMLLSSPCGTPEQAPPPDRWPALQASLQQVAMDMEILDKRETRYVLAKLEDYQEDLDFLRKRRLELAEAPRLSESDRLPSRQTVADYIRFNRAYRKHLENRLVWEPDRASVIGDAIRETERLYKLWDAMRDATCDFHYVTVRRLALKKLRDMMGSDGYNSGEMPPYVPEWRFAAMK